MKRQAAMKKGSAVAAALILGVMPSAHSDAGWRPSQWFEHVGQTVTGSGRSDREVRDVTGFDSIESRGSTDIDVVVGGGTSVAVEADDNIIPLIVTERRGQTLVVRSRGSYRSQHNTRVVVTVPSLNRVATEGSGDVHLRGLSGGELSLAISGSGDIHAAGAVDRCALTINGSGDADLDALAVRSATVSINGSGDATLDVAESLDAVVSGSGDVTYRGNPAKISTRVNGSGEIARR